MTVDMTLIGRSPDHPGRFKSNWPGMRRLMRRMAVTGMLITDAAEPPAGASIVELSRMPPEERKVAGAWLSYHPEGFAGIPWWKLDSNDYWHVTSEECRQALEAWELSGMPPDEADPWFDEWWADWLRFIEAGAAVDGFYVS